MAQGCITHIDFTDCPRVPGRAYNGANGKKINYYDYLHQENFPDELHRVLEQLRPRIMELDFAALIESVPYISTLQKRFYLRYLERRRELMFY